MKSTKITKPVDRERRTYEDACGAAHALDLLGERWALLVVRELMLGPKRFNELKKDLPGISANVLTQRLEALEASAIVLRRKLAPPVSASVYELTPWGYEAEPIFQTLGRWAARSPSHDPSLPISNVSVLMSFRTMIAPARASGIDATIGLAFPDETYRAVIKHGTIEITRGSVEGTDAIIAGPAQMLAAAVYGGQPLASLEAAGALTVTGNRSLAELFLTLFVLPPKVQR